jgi:hypothetical protein
MSRLSDLTAKVASIPAKITESTIVGQLKHYSEKTAEAADKLDRATRGRSFAVLVFPHGDFSNISEKTAKATQAARVIKENAFNLSTIGKLDSHFAQLTDCASSAESTLKNQWKTMVKSRSDDYTKLVDVIVRIQLAPGPALRIALGRFSSLAEKPPLSLEAARSAKGALDAVVDKIREIGLAGEAGTFLIDVVAGRGDLKAIGKPDVRSFLDRYDLWTILKVALR